MLSFLINAFHGLYLATADVLAEHTANPNVTFGIPFIMMVLFALIIIQVVYWLLSCAVFYAKQLLNYIVDYDVIKKRRQMKKKLMVISNSSCRNHSLSRNSRNSHKCGC